MPGYRRTGEVNPHTPVENPADHPGHIYDPAVGAWVSADDWQQRHRGGPGWLQLLTAAAPFMAAGVGALAGGGSAAVPSLSATGGLPAGAFPSMGGAAGAGTAAGMGTAAAGAAKGAGMAFGVKDAVGLVPAILSMFKGSHPATVPQNDAMNGLIQMQTQRMQQADPLYQAILRMAMQLAPISARGELPGAAPPRSAARAVPRALPDAGPFQGGR